MQLFIKTNLFASIEREKYLIKKCLLVAISDEYDSQIGWEIAFYARGTAGPSTSAAPHLRPNDLNHQMARLAIDAANNPSNSQVRVRLNGVDRRALQSAIRLSRRKVNKRPANDPVSKNRLVITCKSELPTRQQFYVSNKSLIVGYFELRIHFFLSDCCGTSSKKNKYVGGGDCGQVTSYTLVFYRGQKDSFCWIISRKYSEEAVAESQSSLVQFTGVDCTNEINGDERFAANRFSTFSSL